jgi:hypothetical protein
VMMMRWHTRRAYVANTKKGLVYGGIWTTRLVLGHGLASCVFLGLLRPCHCCIFHFFFAKDVELSYLTILSCRASRYVFSQRPAHSFYTTLA